MTDREMLELAALAAGIKGEWSKTIGGWDCLIVEGASQPWQPLHDDGDALRLAVKLGIDLTHCYPGVIQASHGSITEGYGLGGDPYAATRRAITRAAAELGRQLSAHKGTDK